MLVPIKARLALLTGILLAVGWIGYAILHPAPRLDQAKLEEMSRVLEDYRAGHGAYPANLDYLFPAAEVERLEYERHRRGYTLRSRMDSSVAVEGAGETTGPEETATPQGGDGDGNPNRPASIEER